MSLTPSGFERAEYLNAPPPVQSFDSSLFNRALALGIVAMIPSAILYGGFTAVTHIRLGIIALVSAWLIAKAMTIGSNGRGGTPYQVTAVILTLVSVFLGNAILYGWVLRQEGDYPLSLGNILRLIVLGCEGPFLSFTVSPLNGLLGLFILFIGLRAAWRMTSGNPGAVRHPFAR